MKGKADAKRAALRAALGLSSQPEETVDDDDDDDNDECFDAETAEKHNISWADPRALLNGSDVESEGSSSELEDSDHEEEPEAKSASQKRKVEEEQQGEPSSSWGVGDRVTLEGRLGVVKRDMRPKFPRATVVWEDTKEEQRKVDAQKIQLFVEPDKKKKKGSMKQR